MITISPIKKRVRKISFGELLDYDHDIELGRTGQNDPLIINRFEKNNENLEDF